MIKAFMVMNTQGKPRLAKFCDYQPMEKQQELIRSVFSVFRNVCKLDIVFIYTNASNAITPVRKSLSNWRR